MGDAQGLVPIQVRRELLATMPRIPPATASLAGADTLYEQAHGYTRRQIIAPHARPGTRCECEVVQRILAVGSTPQAILVFSDLADGLGDYWYWFTLGTLWVDYSGWSDLELWRRLFTADRPRRRPSLMKPYELAAYRSMPDTVTVYRATRPGELDRIAYTRSRQVAEHMAVRRAGPIIVCEVRRSNILALFLRRSEEEVIVLDPRDAVAEQADA